MFFYVDPTDNRCGYLVTNTIDDTFSRFEEIIYVPKRHPDRRERNTIASESNRLNPARPMTVSSVKYLFREANIA